MGLIARVIEKDMDGDDMVIKYKIDKMYSGALNFIMLKQRAKIDAGLQSPDDVSDAITTGLDRVSIEDRNLTQKDILGRMEGTVTMRVKNA